MEAKRGGGSAPYGFYLTSCAAMRIWRWDLVFLKQRKFCWWCQCRIFEPLPPTPSSTNIWSMQGTDTPPQTRVFLKRVMFLQWERSCHLFWTLKKAIHPYFQAITLLAYYLYLKINAHFSWNNKLQRNTLIVLRFCRDLTSKNSICSLGLRLRLNRTHLKQCTPQVAK